VHTDTVITSATEYVPCRLWQLLTAHVLHGRIVSSVGSRGWKADTQQVTEGVSAETQHEICIEYQSI